MNILHGGALVLLCIIIVFNIKIPDNVRKIGDVPLTVGLLLIIFYLFTKNPILGIVALVAGYEMMQRNITYNSDLPMMPVQDKFGETLEEDMVSNMVPMAQTPTPSYLNFKYSMGDSHNASTLN